jgi:putative endonuclease
MWFVYALYSRIDDLFYIGITNDIDRRVQEHRQGKTQTTQRMDKPELIYYEACSSKQDAMARERQLKTGFGRGYLRRRLQHSIMGLYLNDTDPHASEV